MGMLTNALEISSPLKNFIIYIMIDLRTKTGIKPMFENDLETFASDIGSQTIVVRRANIRFAPTLVSDIGWISIK